MSTSTGEPRQDPATPPPPDDRTLTEPPRPDSGRISAHGATHPLPPPAGPDGAGVRAAERDHPCRVQDRARERLSRGDWPAHALEPGTLFADYVICDLLGSGGMGDVYLAWERDLRVHRALKRLVHGAGGDQAAALFRREIRTLARLDHPHVVRMYEAVGQGRLLGCSMEYVEGRSLAVEIKERGALPPREAVTLAAQAARALGYAHGRGVVHRDVKPANLLLDREGHIKVVDFGIAGRFQPQPDGTSEGEAGGSPGAAASTGVQAATESAVGDTGEWAGLTAAGAGTPAYMAPEQWEAQDHGGPVGPRADVWALGATLFECLRGVPVFREGREAMLAARLGRLPKSVDLRGGLPRGLAVILERCLAWDPEARYRDGTGAAQALEAWLQTGHVGDPALPAWYRAATRLRAVWRRRKVPVLAAAVVLLAVGLPVEWGRREARRRESAAALQRVRDEVGQTETAGRELNIDQKITLTMDLVAVPYAETVDGCLALLDDPSPGLQEVGARVLGRLGSRAVAEPLAAVLEDAGRTDPVRLAAAEALARIGGDRAFGAVERVVQEDPRLRLRLLPAFGRLMQARAEATGDIASNLLRQSVARLGAGEPEPALRLADRALALEPGSPGIRFQRACVLTQLDRLPEAIGEYREALALQPDNADVLANLARALVRAGDYRGAVAACDKALALDPGHVPALIHRAHARGELDETQAALADLDQAVQLDPRSAEALGMRGWVLLEAGRLEEAEQALDHALDLDPSQAIAWLHRGTVRTHLGRSQEAIQDLTHALDIEQDADTYYNRAFAYMQLRLLDQALDDYDAALRLEPDLIEARVNRGGLLHERDRYEEAVAEFDRLLSDHPGYPGALYRRAAALAALGRHRAAVEDLDAFLAQDPDHVEGLVLRANVLLSLGRLGEAVADLDRIRRIDPARVPADLVDGVRAWLEREAEQGGPR